MRQCIGCPTPNVAANPATIQAQQHTAPSPIVSEPQPDLKTTARQVVSFVRPYRWGAALTLLAYLGAAITEPLIPHLIKTVFSDGFKPDAFSVWWVPVALIGLYIVRGIFGFLGSYLLSWTTWRTVMDLRRALADTLLKADATVYTSLPAGNAVSKVVNDPHQFMTLLAGASITVLRDGLPTIATLGYLLYLNWQLTLLSLVTLPLMAYVMKRINRRVQRIGALSYDAQMRLAAKVDDLVRAWRVVRSFDAAAHEREQFASLSKDAQQQALKNSATNATIQPLSQLVAAIGLSLIITIALLQARENNTGVGEFAAFVTALLLLSSRLRHLSELSQPIVNGLVIARACFSLFQLPAEPDTGQRSLKTPVKGDLDLQDIRLQYPGAETPALEGLSLKIPAGKTTALIGASGAGKSSVIHLLLGFAQPDGGRILLDGEDAADIKKAELRRQFAVVSQDIVLFDSSIADNVAYAQAKDPARLEQVLRAAHLWDFVQSLPQGLDTPVGANGSKLSGGQRQRLAIARALYKEAPIWVFDEATSALDTESERAVQQALEQWQGKKTLILIAHRLSTVRAADAIHVLAQGRVLESGSHAELMARGGAYAAMVQAQVGD